MSKGKLVYIMSPSKHSRILNTHGHVSCVNCEDPIEIGQQCLSSRCGRRGRKQGTKLYCMTCAEELYLI